MKQNENWHPNRKFPESDKLLRRVWRNMKMRCLNPKAQNFKWYGAKSIKICEEWLTWEVFRDWAWANGYKEGLSIERIDNLKNYEPLNCKWIPLSQQARHSSQTKKVIYKGKECFLIDLAEERGIPLYVVKDRLRKLKWSVEDAVDTPQINFKKS